MVVGVGLLTVRFAVQFYELSMKCRIAGLATPWGEYWVGMPGQWIDHPLEPGTWAWVWGIASHSRHENDVSEKKNKILVFHMFLLPETWAGLFILLVAIVPTLST